MSGFNLAPSEPVLQNMHLSFSTDGRTPEFKPLATSPPSFHSSNPLNASVINGADATAHGGEALGINFSMSTEPLKKKRGRPRKYGPDGAMALGSAPKLPNLPVNQPSGGSASPSTNSSKKARGRPPGSSKKRQLQLLGKLFYCEIVMFKAFRL